MAKGGRTQESVLFLLEWIPVKTIVKTTHKYNPVFHRASMELKGKWETKHTGPNLIGIAYSVCAC